MVIAIHQARNLEHWFRELVTRGARDMFFVPGEPPAFRMGEKIERTDEAPLSAAEIRDLALAYFGEEELARIGRSVGAVRGACEVMIGGERKDKTTVSPAAVTARASVTVSRSEGDYTIAIRLHASRPLTAKEAGLPKAVTNAARASNGLVLFSGKRAADPLSTAAALVDHLNGTLSGHICTVEDPIEYRLQPKGCLVQHKEVGVDVPTLVDGIDAAMRHDVDVLFAPFPYRPEEFDALLMAAQDRLVVTVTFAESCEAAVKRLLQLAAPESQAAARAALANRLCCVTCQRLLPRADGKGRVPAYEVLLPDDELAAAITAGRSLAERQGPLPEGSQTMAKAVARLRESGYIDEQTARANGA